MTEEEKDLQTNETGNDSSDTDYLAAIKELKQNSVPRAEFDKLKAQNKELLNAVVNGQEAPNENQVVIHTQEEIQKLRNELYGPNAHELNNLDYMKKTLELREAIIENGGRDPFVTFDKENPPTREDFENADFAAKSYQECIDIADGDSVAFTNELMRRVPGGKLPPRFVR